MYCQTSFGGCSEDWKIMGVLFPNDMRNNLIRFRFVDFQYRNRRRTEKQGNWGNYCGEKLVYDFSWKYMKNI